MYQLFLKYAKNRHKQGWPEKNPPKKNHPKKPKKTQKNPPKKTHQKVGFIGFFWVFLIFLVSTGKISV